MTHGTVVGLQARVMVSFVPTGQPDVQIEFVIDTGFEGALTLPTQAVAALSLTYLEQLPANLADDSPLMVDVHLATIRWDAREVDVAVLAMGKRPLLGTALLDGFNLNVDFEDSGSLSLQRL